jgi:CRISPR-associated endonuclease Cas1
MSAMQRPLRPQRGVLALSGYGLRLAVERGHLTITDGAGRSRRKGRFSRVTPGLKRVIILGTSGTVTLDPLRWLGDVRAHVVQIDHDGRLVTLSAMTRLNDARLRRAQALALSNGLGLEMARELISAKIAGQADTIVAIPAGRDTATALRESLFHVANAPTLDRVRYVEARAAFAYWNVWSALEIRFPTREEKHIPTHWRTLGDRHSPLSNGPRRGVTPLNAILNYCYAIAEAEARLALVAAGCDPGLGVLHADEQGRDSLALDILEPIRPHVDAFVLRLAREHTFARSDFFESRNGVCRLMPSVAAMLSETAGQWAKLAQPIAHRVGRRFERAGATRNLLPSAVSRELSADTSQPRLPQLLRARQPRGNAPASAVKDESRCRRCGTTLVRKRRKYCSDCISTLPAMASEYARIALKRRQRSESGAGPSANTRLLIGDARTRRAAEMRAWEASRPVIPALHIFAQSVLPMLEGVRAQDIRDATALSISYCRRVLRGQYTPHPMHWEAIKALARR